MEPYDVELHALAHEIADLDGLEYGEALDRARRELDGLQQYARDWNKDAVAPSAPYLQALATLKQGTCLTPEHIQQLIAHDEVVRHLSLQVLMWHCLLFSSDAKHSRAWLAYSLT